MRNQTTLPILGLILLCAAAAASADELPTAQLAGATPAEARSWYSWQTLLADVSAGAVPLLVNATGANGEQNRRGFEVGVALFALGAPLVHFANGRPGNGFASLGLRLALPLGLAGLGYAIGNSSCKPSGFFGGAFCGYPEATAGAIVGVVAASAIDATILAWKPAAKPLLSPLVDLRRGTDGFGGRF